MPNRESNKTTGAKGAARQDVSRYRELREAMGWSRETAAAELGMSDDKLERIENGRQMPNPQDVLVMSRVYQAPARAQSHDQRLSVTDHCLINT